VERAVRGVDGAVGARAVSKNACGTGLAQLKAKFAGEGFFAIVTQKGCPPCPPAKRLLKKAVGRKLRIVEIPVEDERCDPILTQLKVTDSPSIFFFKGKRTVSITRGDKTDDQIRAQVAAVMGKGKK
jgi:hypothetical protein